jgi:outer membrane protein
MTAKMFLVNTMAFIIVLASLSTAAAQEKVLSLSEALAWAMKDNPALRAAGDGLLAQKEEMGIARSFLLPKLSFEERFMRTNNPTYVFMSKLNEERFTAQDFAIGSLNNPSAVNDFQTSFSFEQAVFAPKAFIGVKMAKKEFEAQGDEFDRKKEEVAFRVFETYLGVQTAKSYVNAAEKGVEDAEEHLRIARARFDSELGLYSDTLRAKVALSTAEERLVSARKNLAVGKRALGLMLGLTEPVDTAEERSSLETKTLEYYSGMAMQRKDLLTLEARYQNAKNMLKMANAGYLPNVGVGGTYQLNDHSKPFGTEGDSWQIAAFLRWDLFDGAKREHERRRAIHRISEAEEYVKGFRKELSFKVYDAYLGVEESRKSLDLARASLNSAEEGTRLVRKRYENSLSPMVDLLDAQAALDAARADVIGREGDCMTAIANVAFQSGTILKELGVEK